MRCLGSKCKKSTTCALYLSTDEELVDFSVEVDPKYGCEIRPALCGDNGALGYHRYKNSIGLCYDEKCVACPHSSLCFRYLEFSGCITKGASPIYAGCGSILSDPEKAANNLLEKLAAWRELCERSAAQKSVTHAEGKY